MLQPVGPRRARLDPTERGRLPGLNPCGQGGDGTTMDRPVPTRVAGPE